MDFVIAWVNGNDPKWQEEYKKYKSAENGGDTHFARFRNWDNLQYWFRGVEKFAPWVNQIHLITWGHLPEWLNTDHPKLNIVNHRDFIPEKYLPTFNSRTIDLNFHRIKELDEEYVYFNDDMFLINTMKESDFFVKGKPCDMPVFATISGDSTYLLTLQKNNILLNRNFVKKETVQQQSKNWFNFKYGIKNNLKNYLLYTIDTEVFSGFMNPHLPQACKKSTLKELWQKEPKEMDYSCSFSFRNHATVNQYLQRYWQFAKNDFHPTNLSKLGTGFRLQKTAASTVAKFIKNQEKSIVCINDHIEMKDSFDIATQKINSAFEEILPDRSGFEA